MDAPAIPPQIADMLRGMQETVTASAASDAAVLAVAAELVEIRRTLAGLPAAWDILAANMNALAEVLDSPMARFGLRLLPVPSCSQ